jgi:hypothetical protein
VSVLTSSSCHALEQAKVIVCVLVSFCCGLGLIDSLGHPLTNEAENRINNETYSFTDMLAHVMLASLQVLYYFHQHLHVHHPMASYTFPSKPTPNSILSTDSKVPCKEAIAVFHSIITQHKLLK